MIADITLTGLHVDLDDRTKKYVHKKIAALDRYLPRHARKSARAEVVLTQVNRDHGNKYQAEVIMHLPDQTITAKDSTLSMIAAIDIVEAKVINQMRRYKQRHTDHRGPHGLVARFKQRLAREATL